MCFYCFSQKVCFYSLDRSALRGFDEKRVLTVLAEKCGISGKYVFTIAEEKYVFIVLEGKMCFFAVLAGKYILCFWQKNVFLRF